MKNTQMTQTEKRLAIVNDALQQLKLKKFVACSGTYFVPKASPSYNYKTDEDYCLNREFIQNELNAEGGACYVCVKGALFASKLNVLNDYEKEGICVDTDEIYDALDGIFAPEELCLYEHLFESEAYSAPDLYYEDGALFENFEYEYYPTPIFLAEIIKYQALSDTEKLTLLLDTLLANNGKFKFSFTDTDEACKFIEDTANKSYDQVKEDYVVYP